MTVLFYKDPIPLIEVIIKKKEASIDTIILLKKEYKIIQSLFNDDLSKFAIEIFFFEYLFKILIFYFQRGIFQTKFLKATFFNF
jgi:hypothetical protein